MTQAEGWGSTSATGSASFNEMALENLYVTDTAAVNNLSVSETIVLGSDLVISSLTTHNSLPTTSIDTVNAPLSIQSSAIQPLYLMAGLVTIDTQGNVQIAGDLNVAGNIESSGLTLSENPATVYRLPATESGFGKLLSLFDSKGTEVAAISASGSAEFAQVTTDTLTVRSDPQATESATFAGIIYSRTASAGQARIHQGTREVIISHPKITKDSLIFVPPTSGTGNFVIYVKRITEL